MKSLSQWVQWKILGNILMSFQVCIRNLHQPELGHVKTPTKPKKLNTETKQLYKSDLIVKKKKQ